MNKSEIFRFDGYISTDKHEVYFEDDLVKIKRKVKPQFEGLVKSINQQGVEILFVDEIKWIDETSL